MRRKTKLEGEVCLIHRQGLRGAVAALQGRQEKRAGRAQLGPRKLQDCSPRGGGSGEGGQL